MKVVTVEEATVAQEEAVLPALSATVVAKHVNIY